MITGYIVEGQDHGRPIVAALEVDETGTVINAAPILKRAVGRPISWIMLIRLTPTPTTPILVG